MIRKSAGLRAHLPRPLLTARAQITSLGQALATTARRRLSCLREGGGTVSIASFAGVGCSGAEGQGCAILLGSAKRR
jgi:hypothetical protein